jgi:hypothetical protein
LNLGGQTERHRASDCSDAREASYDGVVTAELNDTFYPILLSRIEEPLAPSELDRYFKKLVSLADAAISKREKYVVIVVSDVMKVNAAGRKQLALVQARYLTPERNDRTLAAFLPIDNAFVRGAVTALRWLSPELTKSIHVVASLEVALNEALRVLEANGTPFTGERPALRRALGIRNSIL